MAYLNLKKGSGARRSIQYSDHSSDSNEKTQGKLRGATASAVAGPPLALCF
jgi:hypothetical protein